MILFMFGVCVFTLRKNKKKIVQNCNIKEIEIKNQKRRGRGEEDGGELLLFFHILFY
jgi:hypothetical protein